MKGFFMAFAMYSRIPVPQIEWKEENRRLALCFFPLIGLLIGSLSVFWYCLCKVLQIGSLMFSAIAAAIPVIVTGGIHLDGFCDVQDAKACLGSREKSLEVMSDSHIGAFAAIHLAIYIVVQIGIFSEIKNMRLMIICSLGYVLSRAWSGLAAVTFPCAKKQGTLQSFVKPAHKSITILVELLYLFAVFAVMLKIDVIIGLAVFFISGLTFIYYRHFSVKRFGGITGDLAGYFLQICELSVTAAAVGANLILEALQ